MKRRGFLGAILAAGMAPAIVRAESLMKIIVPPHKSILTPDLIAKEMLSRFERDFHTLMRGDIFTIAGIDQKFVVTDVHSPKGIIQIERMLNARSNIISPGIRSNMSMIVS